MDYVYKLRNLIMQINDMNYMYNVVYIIIDKLKLKLREKLIV